MAVMSDSSLKASGSSSVAQASMEGKQAVGRKKKVAEVVTQGSTSRN
jgi:hypothetical protein